MQYTFIQYAYIFTQYAGQLHTAHYATRMATCLLVATRQHMLLLLRIADYVSQVCDCNHTLVIMYHKYQSFTQRYMITITYQSFTQRYIMLCIL